MWWYLTDKKYRNQMRKIKQINLQKRKLYKLKAEKEKKKRKFKLPSTSKLLLLGAVLLCLEIVIFCEYVMLKFQDTSALYVLIGIPASLIPVILGYFYKSKAENTSGGIVYETAMSQIAEPVSNSNNTESNNDDAVG